MNEFAGGRWRSAWKAGVYVCVYLYLINGSMCVCESILAMCVRMHLIVELNGDGVVMNQLKEWQCECVTHLSLGQLTIWRIEGD